MLNNFLQALIRTGVAICGGGVVQPLAGRSEAPGSETNVSSEERRRSSYAADSSVLAG